MKEVTLKAYLFEELSEKAKQAAIVYERAIQDIYLDTDRHVEDLEEQGFLNPKIFYSGFGSQGDGACFTANVDIERFCVGKYASLMDIHLDVKFTRLDCQYSHEGSMRLEIFTQSWATEEQVALAEELEDELEALRYKLSKDIYEHLKEDFDHLNSDEYISDELINREEYFHENGEVFKEANDE
jgi:hypothetical protein